MHQNEFILTQCDFASLVVDYEKWASSDAENFINRFSFTAVGFIGNA